MQGFFVSGWLGSEELAYVIERLLKISLESIAFLFVFSLGVALLEALSGGNLKHYLTRNFLHDFCYGLWQHSGILRALFLATFIIFAQTKLEPYNLHLLSGLPMIGQSIAAYLVGELAGYWLHRLMHSNRFLWAFHCTHHSQETMTWVTSFRVHPLEDFVRVVLTYTPLYVLGVQPILWVPLRAANIAIGYLQHSRIHWRLGPLRYVLATPAFHAFHHSQQARHFDRNFAPTLALMDYLFGTASWDDEGPGPLGLPDVKMPTLASTLTTPFAMLREFYLTPKETTQTTDSPAPTTD